MRSKNRNLTHPLPSNDQREANLLLFKGRLSKTTLVRHLHASIL